MTPPSGSSTSPEPESRGRPLVGHQHHRLEPAQVAVGAPILGEFDAGAGELARILLELGLQSLEQREGVGGGSREAADDLTLGEAAHLAGVALDDGLAEADLAVAADDDASRLFGPSGWWWRAWRGEGVGQAANSRAIRLLGEVDTLTGDPDLSIHHAKATRVAFRRASC